MNDQHETSNSHHVREALQRAADDLALGAVDPAGVRERVGRRRRRRRAALAGGGAVVAVALVGAVVANRDVGDDTLELANPPETTAASADEVADTAPAPTVPVTAPPTLPPVADAGAEIATTQPAAAIDDVVQLLPWRDGFLSIGFRYEPQPLPELSEEMIELFPDEVRAAFPDGLPATIDEATEVLAEADLLDEVLAAFEEHPDLAEAVYAVEPPPPTIVAAYTVDGSEWSPVELVSPTRYPGQFIVSGDRLVTWSTDPSEPTDADGPRELLIAHTDDLVEWDTDTIPLEDDGSAADVVRRDVFVNGIGIVGDRWLAQVESHSWVDYDSLLPDDVQQEIRSSAIRGYSTSTSIDGITIDLENAEGSSTTYEFTWAELGLDGDPQQGNGEQEPEPKLLLGELGGTHEEVPVPAGYRYGSVSAAGGEFFLVGDEVHVSVDGRNWSPVDGLPDDRWFNSATEVAGGVMFVGDGPDGPAAWLRTPDGAVTDVELPELPDRYGLWNSNATSAWIVEVGFPEEPDWTPVTITLEHEGYGLRLTDGPDGTSFVLTDGSGAVVRDATVSHDDGVNRLWEYDEETGVGWLIIRDDAGVEIVRIPDDVVNAAYDEAFAAQEPPRSEPEAEEWRPDLWLLATVDGSSWLTLDLDDPDDETPFWPNAAAANGGSVLYRTVDGWALETIPTG